MVAIAASLAALASASTGEKARSTADALRGEPGGENATVACRLAYAQAYGGNGPNPLGLNAGDGQLLAEAVGVFSSVFKNDEVYGLRCHVTLRMLHYLLTGQLGHLEPEEFEYHRLEELDRKRAAEPLVMGKPEKSTGVIRHFNTVATTGELASAVDQLGCFFGLLYDPNAATALLGYLRAVFALYQEDEVKFSISLVRQAHKRGLRAVEANVSSTTTRVLRVVHEAHRASVSAGGLSGSKPRLQLHER